MPQQFGKITANLVGKPRPAVMEGRNYIVLRVVPIREGVHHGSNGPTLYEFQDIKTYASAWNHKPIVINHPTDSGGGFVSADDPAILNASKVGLLMASGVEGDKQIGEAWLEVERLRSIEPRLLKALEKGMAIEVSTGLFADNEEKSGLWNNEAYTQIARNYRPDHLAILPDTVGACSVGDGCGMFGTFSANEKLPFDKMEKIHDVLQRVWKNEEQLTGNCSCKHSNKEISMDTKAKVAALIATGDWAETDREWLEGLEAARLDKMVAANKKQIDLIEANQKKAAAEKKAKVDALIDNKTWTEKDREWLTGLEDQALGKLAKMLEKQVQNEEEPQPQTAEEFIAKAPVGIREMLTHGLSAHKAERNRYEDMIFSNKLNKFSKDELKNGALFSTDQLRKMAALCVEEEPELAPIYSGNVGSFNMDASDDVPGLPVPQLNFDHRLKK